MEDITSTDYLYEKGVFKEFGIKRLGEYHNLNLKSDTLLLAGLIENFRKMCLEIY